jgi:hypothetical protein
MTQILPNRILLRAAFDWREYGPPIWEITVETSDGTLALAEVSAGGHGRLLRLMMLIHRGVE